MKLVGKTATFGNRLVKVYWDADWEEFQCVLYEGGKKVSAATYHTDCEVDANDTAIVMARGE